MCLPENLCKKFRIIEINFFDICDSVSVAFNKAQIRSLFSFFRIGGLNCTTHQMMGYNNNGRSVTTGTNNTNSTKYLHCPAGSVCCQGKCYGTIKKVDDATRTTMDMESRCGGGKL